MLRWLPKLLPGLALAGAVALLLVPVPTPVVDVLIVGNLAMAVLLVLVALSSPSARALSTLPGILVLTTLLRLALNVSTTRLILGQADAGAVVQAFGEFVVAGSYIVGAVVFLILTVVQYVVIAAGAGRVAEVAARFSLDALPGNQLAIDADLRSGAIDRLEAERRRRALDTESRLHGALDGAMRFVRGDAIAGLLITAVNLVGGVALGTSMRGLSTGEAMRAYGLLTIGDGLAAQIPAVLLSVAAGLVVTRVTDAGDQTPLPKAIGVQLLRSPENLVAAAALLTVLGLVPGLPAAPFLLVAAVLGWAAWLAGRRAKAGEGEGPPPRLELRVGPDLARALGGPVGLAALARAASGAASGPLALRPPRVAVRVGPGDGPDAWRLDLDSAPCGKGTLDPSEPAAASAKLAAALGPALAGALPEMLGVQEAREALDAVARHRPALAHATVPSRLDLPTLASLQRELVADGLPAGDLAAVLETVAALPGDGPAPRAQLSAAGRRAFRRHLTGLATQAGPDGGAEVRALALDDAFRSAFEEQAQAATHRHDSELASDLTAALGSVERDLGLPRVLLVPAGIRAEVQRAAGGPSSELLVLSNEDLLPGVAVEPTATLRAPSR